MKKKALVFGATGQDGSYLLELLLKKKYEVHCLIRKSATSNTKNIDHILSDNKYINKSLFIHKGDLLDWISLNNLINNIIPDEIYNFADQDHVVWSGAIPSYSFKITALAVIEILEILKNQNKKIKYFQPISSNIFGLTDKKKQNEKTTLNPNSIYGLAKATAYLACKMYSRTHNLFLCGAIFYNHESPKRSNEYVSKKIVEHVCQIKKKKKKVLYLGDIKAKIDWGYAKEYVEAAWKIMQQKKPDFFVIGTGEINSVEFFVKHCFLHVGLDYKKYIKIDKKLLRKGKTNILSADTKKKKKLINFKIETKLKKLIKIMMEAELEKFDE